MIYQLAKADTACRLIQAEDVAGYFDLCIAQYSLHCNVLPVVITSCFCVNIGHSHATQIHIKV